MLKPVLAALARLVACATVALLVGAAPVAAGDHPNVVAAKGIYAAFGKGDAAAILAAVSPDVHWEVVGRQSDCPCLGVRKGKAGVEEFLKLVDDMYAFSEFTIQGFHPSGDKVFVLGHYAATNKATKMSFASDWIHVLTFRDGKLVSFREFLDTASEVEAGKPK